MASDRLSALRLLEQLVETLLLEAGQLVVHVQHPGRITTIDINRRVHPNELEAVTVRPGQV